MHSNEKISMSISDQSRLLRARAKELGLTQLKISQETGLSQSQVSRLLDGKSCRESKGFDRVCRYVFSYTPSISQRRILRQTDLMMAIAEVWDGTPSHADALATILRSLKLLHGPRGK